MKNETYRIRSGDTVTLAFTGTTAEGEIFESSEEKGGPCRFKMNDPAAFRPFVQAAMGMAIGEEKTITLPPDEAYGDHKPELVHVLSSTAFGDRVEPRPGMILGMAVDRNGESHQVPTLVLKVENNQVTLDYNHPLAGQTLHYRLKIIDVQPGG